MGMGITNSSAAMSYRHLAPNLVAQALHLERLREARIAKARVRRQAVKPQQSPVVDQAAIDVAIKAIRRQAIADLPEVKAAITDERRKALQANRADVLVRAMKRLRGIA